MKQYIEKIKQIERALNKDYGRLNLFALAERDDLKDKWDVLVSISEAVANKKDVLNNVIIKFREKLKPSEFIQISRFVFLEPEHPFVQSINFLAQVENSDVEITNSMINNIKIGHVIVISSFRPPKR